ncbi:hypothetical protein CKM354_000289000 [Cercospora kikuchii]|uniref:Uncharacterized protein n=1 Tax=Cercospora kikuchii TaxID=84275 RepID=A0A9P3CJ57_9PEZI|nr:uncharacterized protein CKM354_000289000 [Cercospora kikuchii]GIZ39508.1 hypothetical protein CKM354_000289000 [Cercospora kikuchii]
MKFTLALSLFAWAAGGSAQAAFCTAEHRINVMRYITAVFNEKDFLKSAAGIQGMPLEPDCPAIVSVNGAPAVEFGFDASSTKNFANVVRQLFTKVTSKYTDYGNGTTLMDADVVLGTLHVLDFPVNAHILVPAEFDLETCRLQILRANVFVPSAIGGVPVNTPVIPAFPGLDTLPGLRGILAKLPGNPYNI